MRRRFFFLFGRGVLRAFDLCDWVILSLSGDERRVLLCDRLHDFVCLLFLLPFIDLLIVLATLRLTFEHLRL